MLALPEHVYPVFGLCIGEPDQDPAMKPRLPVDVLLHQDRYSLTESEHVLIDGYDVHVEEYYNQRTKGRIAQTWTEQMSKQAKAETRTYMKKYLFKQGFIVK